MTTVELLFGTKLYPVNAVELGRLCGVSPRTIANWRKNPETIPWGKMKLLIRIRRIQQEDLMKMAKEKG